MVDSNAGRLALALAAAIPACNGDDGSGPTPWSLGAETLTTVATGSVAGGLVIEVRCPDGSVGVGYEGREGANIDHIRLLCAELGPGGTLGTWTVTGAIGSSTGGIAFNTECAPDSLALTVLVGDRGDYGTHIGRSQGQCRRPADIAAGMDNPSSRRTTAPVGPGGGSTYDLFCPDGSAVTGLRGQEDLATGYLAAIGLICREVHDG
jgi:hypothetical protein